LNSREIPFALTNLLDHLTSYLGDYHRYFETETADGHELCRAYLAGLIKAEAGKRNMERLNEEIDMAGDSYQRIQQFITDSPWSASAVITAMALNGSDLYANQPNYHSRDVGYVIDESAHRKKGKASVGVARQYAGVIGKVDNCQVGVYASLVWQSHSTLINCRLFLPQSWTNESARCDQAGLPADARHFKTKPELALEMIQADLEAGVELGWVGGDGLYGHGHELSNTIENMGLIFLFDVHSNQSIFTTQPIITLPERPLGRGRQPTRPQADSDPVEVKEYAQPLEPYHWRTITVRDGTKGPLTLSVHTRRVWVWDGTIDGVRERVLLISRNLADNKIKYSLSNVDYLTTPIERLAFMQAQRYWVERAFQEAKSELGMSDYQVRKWHAWHHHMALVMLALSFMVKERILAKAENPLLSCRDIRLMIIALLIKDEDLIAKKSNK
jgi:SRSO17 transposase